MLQAGSSANDVLLYFPVYDAWQSSGNLILPNPLPASFSRTALALWDHGYAFDHVSDRFLATAQVAAGKVVLPGGSYQAVLVPSCQLMPEATLRKLAELARQGATILFQDGLPANVPGFGNLEKRRAEFQETVRSLKLSAKTGHSIQRVALRKGAFLIGSDPYALLRSAGVAREPGVDLGLRFVRRADSQGNIYFVANRGDKPVDGFVTLGTSAKSAVLLDPLFEHRVGVAALRQSKDGITQVYLQLQPGESLILRTLAKTIVRGPAWRYFQSAGTAVAVEGSWKVRFLEGGPELPAGFEARELASWTKQGGEEAKRFAGTAAYTIEFDRPTTQADDWLLDLGRVCECARVRINGCDPGPAWCAPFQVRVGEFLRPGKNLLEIEVTNLAANRIADLDRRKVNWKYFYDANVASYRSPGRLLDASNWPLRDSGLLGPVRLQPLKRLSEPQP
jgi:alpha-L-rhamnosidase